MEWYPRVIRALSEQFSQILFYENISLSPYTTMKVGGKALLLVFPNSIDELCQFLYFLSSSAVPFFILGKGSNIIVNDNGVHAVLVSTQNLNKISLDIENPRKILAESGAELVDLSLFAYDQSLSGLEFACGIPGTVGGSVYMNAGAYEGQIQDVLESSDAFFTGFGRINVDFHEHRFSYRKSCFNENSGIILRSSFLLAKANQEQILSKINDFTKKRKEKQPLEFPSSGSIFKRPEGYFVGPIIEKLNLKGYKIGGAKVSEKHAGFIINDGTAKATDIWSLIFYIQTKVKEEMQLCLETEVSFLMEDGRLRKPKVAP